MKPPSGVLQKGSSVRWPAGTRIAQAKVELGDKSIGETLTEAWDKAITEFVNTHGRMPDPEQLLIRGATMTFEVLLEIGELEEGGDTQRERGRRWTEAIQIVTC